MGNELLLRKLIVEIKCRCFITALATRNGTMCYWKIEQCLLDGLRCLNSATKNETVNCYSVAIPFDSALRDLLMVNHDSFLQGSSLKPADYHISQRAFPCQP